MKNPKLNYENSEISSKSNLKFFQFNTFQNNNSLLLPKSHSTNDLHIIKENKNTNLSNIDNLKNKIPDSRMEHYINEYYNNLYNIIYSYKEYDLNNRKINKNRNSFPSLFSNLPISPIDNAQSPIVYSNLFYENNTNKIDKNDINEKNNNYYTIDNNFFSKKFNDELLIEYNNKKRLMELRNKYLSNSSLIFLKKKDEKVELKDDINNENENDNGNGNDNIKNVINKEGNDLHNKSTSINMLYDNTFNCPNNQKIDIVNKNENKSFKQDDFDIVSKVKQKEQNKSNNINSQLNEIKIINNNNGNINEILNDNNIEDKKYNNELFCSKEIPNNKSSKNINEQIMSIELNKDVKTPKSNTMELSKEFKSFLSSNNKYKDINYSKNKSSNNELLLNTIIDIQNKYSTLQNDFNNLLNGKNNTTFREKDIYEHHLISENDKLKKIIDKYELVLDFLLSYINEINIFFDLKQIEYFYLKQNILNNDIDEFKKNNYINELADFLRNCKEQITHKSIDMKIYDKKTSMKNEENKNYYDNEDIDILINDDIKKNTIQNKKNNNGKMTSFKNYNNIKIKNRFKRDNSVKKAQKKYINSSCDSIQYKNKYNTKNTTMNKKHDLLNLFKGKKKANKNKENDKYWKGNKLVSYLKIK